MKHTVSGSVALALVMGLAIPISAEAGAGWNQFKQDVKQTGREIGKAGKQVGHGVADGAKKGGKAVKQLFTGNGGGNKGGSSK